MNDVDLTFETPSSLSHLKPQVHFESTSVVNPTFENHKWIKYFLKHKIGNSHSSPLSYLYLVLGSFKLHLTQCYKQFTIYRN